MAETERPPAPPYPPNGGSRPIPDPTELTDRLVKNAKAEVREYVDSQLGIRDERLAGIDKATDLRLQSVTDIPDQIDREVQHAKEVAKLQLNDERRFAAAEVAHLREVDDIRFQAAERLASRESELNALALAAAFAAQKEASAKEAEYTRIASVKSETQFSDAIDKLGELFATQTSGLGDKVDDLKDRVGRIENTKQGATETRVEARNNQTVTYALIGLGFTLVLVIIAIVGFVITLSSRG